MTASNLNGLRRNPIENAVIAGKRGQEHHADQKEVDITTFRNGSARQLQWNKPSDDKEQSTRSNPIHLRDVPRTEQHQENTESTNDNNKGGRQRALFPT
jgi:hypothetical protein